MARRDRRNCQECGRPALSESHGPHANKGLKWRKGHDLCSNCHRAALQRAKAWELRNAYAG
jgi:hypothetical protein